MSNIDYQEKVSTIQDDDFLDNIEYLEPKIKIRISIEVDGAEMVDTEYHFSDQFDAHSRDWDSRLGKLIDESTERFLNNGELLN